MKKDEKGSGDRAWFLEKELNELNKDRKEEVKAEHADWKKKEHEAEALQKEKTKGYTKKTLKEEGGVEHRHKADKKMGGVRGKPHPETKMDRKGRMDKSS